MSGLWQSAAVFALLHCICKLASACWPLALMNNPEPRFYRLLALERTCMSHPLTEPVMLAELLPEAALINAHVRAALNEDIGSGDVTASLLPAHQYARAEVITREPAVLSGRAWFDAAFRLLDDELTIEWQAADGEQIEPGQLLCRLHGRLRSLLTAERTALNYLQVLSGTATRAHRYAEAVRGLPVRILDTRKTLPGLRREQKYAVACGGCHNHRMGLFDAILIKKTISWPLAPSPRRSRPRAISGWGWRWRSKSNRWTNFARRSPPGPSVYCWIISRPICCAKLLQLPRVVRAWRHLAALRSSICKPSRRPGLMTSRSAI